MQRLGNPAPPQRDRWFMEDGKDAAVESATENGAPSILNVFRRIAACKARVLIV